MNKYNNNWDWVRPITQNDFYDVTEHCAHMNCPECYGTGRKRNGSMCAHWLSCSCHKCSPYCY